MDDMEDELAEVAQNAAPAPVGQTEAGGDTVEG
jgi:hypothetical protein